MKQIKHFLRCCIVIASSFYFCSACLLCVAGDSITHSETDISIPGKLAQLKQDLMRYPDYSLTFRQVNKNLSTGADSMGEGVLRIHSLNAFHWEYTSEPKNSIVSDGHLLVMITPETEQVMVGKAVDFQDIWSPVSLMNKQDLSASYRISDLTKPTDKTQKIRLYPKKANQSFEYIDLVFHNDQKSFPMDFVIFDKAGSANTLSFSKMTVIDNSQPITIPNIPSTFDVTDFQGNPVNLTSMLKDSRHENN